MRNNAFCLLHILSFFLDLTQFSFYFFSLSKDTQDGEQAVPRGIVTPGGQAAQWGQDKLLHRYYCFDFDFWEWIFGDNL